MKENVSCRWIGGKLWDVFVRADGSITMREVFDKHLHPKEKDVPSTEHPK